MRAVDRGVFNIAGCALFLVLYLILPESGRSMIGIIGGIGVGYSAGYKWQTVFNTFGALAIIIRTADGTAASVWNQCYCVSLYGSLQCHI